MILSNEEVCGWKYEVEIQDWRLETWRLEGRGWTVEVGG